MYLPMDKLGLAVLLSKDWLVFSVIDDAAVVTPVFGRDSLLALESSRIRLLVLERCWRYSSKLELVINSRL